MVLVVAGVVPVEVAFSGFANPATISVASLLIVAAAVQETGLLKTLLDRLLATAGSERSELVRLLTPVAALSGGLLNTGVVATLASPIRSWAESRGKAPSHYLMPLSFASILGGVVTVVGSSTTLLVSGLLAQSGHAPLSILEITPVGLPVVPDRSRRDPPVGPRVLPHREDPLGALDTRAPSTPWRCRSVPTTISTAPASASTSASPGPTSPDWIATARPSPTCGRPRSCRPATS